MSCVAVGGRRSRPRAAISSTISKSITCTPTASRAFLANRQIEGCYNENSDYIIGTEGACTIGRGPAPRIEGKTNWTFEGQQYDMYQKEHDELFAAIRKGQPINDGQRMATSTLLAIMGRMAAYTGQQITWDQALNSQEKLTPDVVDWNGSLENAAHSETGDHEILVRPFALVLSTATLLSAADFRKDVQPVFEQNCTACHGAIKQLGGVRLDTPSGSKRPRHPRCLRRSNPDPCRPAKNWLRPNSRLCASG